LLPAFEKLLSLGKDEFARQNAANEHFIDMLTKFCRQPYSSAGVEFVKYLLSLDATVDVTARDAAGLLPVHHAAQTGNFYLLKYLVTAYPQLDMYAKCPRGRTPLELAQAARRYQFEEVCMFFEKIDGQRSLRKQSIEAKLRFKSNCRVLEVLGAGNFGSVCKVTLADQSTDEVRAELAMMRKNQCAGGRRRHSLRILILMHYSRNLLHILALSLAFLFLFLTLSMNRCLLSSFLSPAAALTS
jgi:hypothetical protein